MIANIPNMVYLAPSNAEEYVAMLDWALDQDKHPVYIAIPSGPVVHAEGPVRTNFDDLNTYEVTRQGSKVAVLALGDFYDLGEKTVEALSSTLGIEATLVKPYFASGVDQNLLDNLVKNHDVTVFEQNDHLGGMMYYGIPRYRLPAENLDYDIDAILSLGVEVRYNTKVGVTVTWEEVEGSHDCVFVAIGAHHFRDLGIDYATREGVFSAVQFLHRSSSGRPIDMAGKDVVIVGGGNVAMDATRTAKRLGAASVRCVYRRRKKDMTALPEEVNAAVEEGCEIVELMSPVRVDAGTDKPIRLVVQPQMPGLYRGGRPGTKPTSAEETAFECDFLIEAIGQVIEYEYFTSKGLPAERGHFQADEAAREMKDDFISTEHLLLGIVSDGSEEVQKACRKIGFYQNDNPKVTVRMFFAGKTRRLGRKFLIRRSYA